MPVGAITSRTSRFYPEHMTEPAPPPAPQPFWTKTKILVAAVAGGLVLVSALVVGVITVVAVSRNRSVSTQPAAAPEPLLLPVETPSVWTPPAVEPDPAAFVLTPKITRKQCFGSAGCNVEFTIDVTYTGPTLSATDTWRVTYEVSGVEDGPMVNTFEVTGTSAQVQDTEFASTSGSRKKLTAKVTDIEKAGF